MPSLSRAASRRQRRAWLRDDQDMVRATLFSEAFLITRHTSLDRPQSAYHSASGPL